MRCIRPIKRGYDRFGNVVSSPKLFSPELCPFEIECGKCLACRLNKARDKAVRCWHESKYHENSIFLTLTYDDKKCPPGKLLDYTHFQLFMKSLREKRTRNIKTKEGLALAYIPMMVTGEYGDKNKRPHWHALLFNYKPSDAVYDRATERGDKVYTSQEIDDLWGRGNTEFGEVTIDSANYVARYAAKKLTHGPDDSHQYHPIHRTSSRRAIGRTWIERNYERTFTQGTVVLPNGAVSRIPRYYHDWCKKYQPDLWWHYISEVRPRVQEYAEKVARQEEIGYLTELASYTGGQNSYPLTRPKVKETILKLKFKRLQERLKL